MKNIHFYLLAIFFILTNSITACPDCMGKVQTESPSFFDEELYASPTSTQNDKYYRLDPYPYQMLPEQMDPYDTNDEDNDEDQQ